jgi:hypothetical protein
LRAAATNAAFISVIAIDRLRMFVSVVAGYRSELSVLLHRAPERNERAMTSQHLLGNWE